MTGLSYKVTHLTNDKIFGATPWQQGLVDSLRNFDYKNRTGADG